jgi:hypothetical protein
MRAIGSNARREVAGSQLREEERAGGHGEDEDQRRQAAAKEETSEGEASGVHVTCFGRSDRCG